MAGLMGSGNTPTNAPIRYSGLNVGTSQQNLPVPIFWGTVRLSPNAMAFANFQSHAVSGKGGGKGGGGKSQQQLTYTADVLLGLCEGPVDSIQNIWSNGSTTTTTTLSKLGMTFFSGTLGQAAWSFWNSNYPGLQQGYSQTAYLGAVGLNLGQAATIPDNGFECVRAMGFSYTRSSTVAGWINPNSHVQANAVDVLMSDVIPDFLTNAQYGAFMASGDLGPLTQYAAYCRAQGLFVSPLLNSQEKANDILNRWAQITNSWIFWSGVQLEFVPLADAPITGNGVTFTPANDIAYALTLDNLIASNSEPPVKVSRKDPADCANRTSVNITDRTLGYIDNPIQWYDDTLINAYGLRESASISASEIKDPAVGAVVAQLTGKRAAYIRNAYEFRTSGNFILALPGTVLTIPLNYTGQTVRVRVTDVAEDENGILTFSAEEFPGTVGTYVAPQNTASITTALVPNLLATPSAVNTPAIIEPPSGFTGGTAKLIVAASGQTNWGGCAVWISFDNSKYSLIGQITAPAPQGTLTAALTAYGGANPDTGNTLAVDCTESNTVPHPVSNADAQALRTLSLIAAQPSVTGGVATVPTNGELLAFGAVSATGTNTANLTYLERGQFGSSAGAHSVGDQFTLIDILGSSGTALSYNLPAQYIGQTIYLKFASYNLFGNAAQDLSTCVAYKYTPLGTGYGTGAAGVPQVPTGLAGVTGSTTAALTWNANAAADNVISYRLFRATGSGAAFGSAALIWQGYALTYVDATVASSTAYTYFLEATNAVGTSSATAGVTLTTSASGVLTSANFIFNEVPTGATNGTNKVFTLSQTPIAGQLTLSVNGVVQAPSAYTLSGTTITFGTAPASAAVILATYLH